MGRWSADEQQQNAGENDHGPLHLLSVLRQLLAPAACGHAGVDGGDHDSPCREMSSRSPWWEGPSSATRRRGPLSSRKTTECGAGTACAVRPIIMIERVIWVARRTVARLAARQLRR